MKININEITSSHVNEEIETRGVITEVKSVKSFVKTGVFECKSCMKLHEIEQKSLILHQPAICNECGGRLFKFLPEQSKYVDFQELVISDCEKYTDKYGRKRDSKSITCYAFDKDVYQHLKDDVVNIKGTIRIYDKNDYFLEIDYIELEDKEIKG